MKSKHVTVWNALHRVQRFMDTHDATLRTLNTSDSRRVLDEVVVALKEHAVTQAASVRMGMGETAKQRKLRNVLRLNHMRSIARIAAAQLRDVPEFAALKMPAADSTSRRLIAAAGAMAVAAEEYRAAFIEAGLPGDFLELLRGAAGALNASIANRGAMAATRSGATAGLKAQTERGRQTIKVLDSLIEPLLGGDAVLLGQWKAAKRIGRAAAVSAVSIDAAASGPNVNRESGNAAVIVAPWASAG